MRRLLTRPVVWLALAACVVVAVGAAALAGAFDDDGSAEAEATAQAYSDALNNGVSDELAGVTCAQPNAAQASAFDRRAGSSTLRWSVLDAPRIEDDIAHVTLRAVDGKRHRDYPFTLHRRDDGWCAFFNWARLDAG